MRRSGSSLPYLWLPTGRGSGVSGPVFRALLNEGSGAPTSDAGDTATVDTTAGANTPGWTETGPFGAAPRFDHSGAADTGAWRFDLSTAITGLAEWTVAVWARYEDVATSRWIGVLRNAANVRIAGPYPYDSNDGIWLGQNNGGWDSEFHDLGSDNYRDDWHHWVVAFSESTQLFTVWLDGELVSDTSTIGSATRNSASTAAVEFDTVYIGADSVGGDGLVGSVQDYRVYDRILTDSEVSGIHAVGAAGL